MIYLFLFIIFASILETKLDSDDGGLSNLKKLRDDLLKNYDKRTRPVRHHSNTTNVELTLRPFYISELNEVKNSLVLDAWIYLTWQDEHLVWKPSDYQGLEYLPVSLNDIWKPDISIFSSNPAMNVIPFGNTDIVLYSDGTVKWTPPATIKNACFLDYSKYPYDEQTCNLRFASWTYHGLAINITFGEDAVSLEGLRNTNPYWKLKDIKPWRDIKYYDCCPEPYITVYYNVTLSRNPTIDQQLEWILSVGVVILTLAVFWLPPTSETKLTVGSINILVITGLLMYLVSSMKSDAALPYIAKLLNFSLYTVISAILFEIFVINMALVFGPCSPPEPLYNAISGTVGRILLLDIAEPPGDDAKKTSPGRKWLTVATFTDRILFAVYLIVLLSIPKTG